MLRTLSIRDFVIVDAIELEFVQRLHRLYRRDRRRQVDPDRRAGSWRWAGAATPAWCAKARPRPTSAPISRSAARPTPGWTPTNSRVEEGGALLRRVIDNAGRSKAYINGIAATATQLRELGELLVDIHGQHAHQSLLKADAQRALLDNQAGLRGATAKAVGAAPTRLARAGAPARGIRDQCQERAARARAARMAGGRTGKAGRQAGRVGRDQQRTQPPVARGQPDRRRAGSADRDFRVGRASDPVAAVVAEPEARQAGRRRRRPASRCSTAWSRPASSCRKRCMR